MGHRNIRPLAEWGQGGQSPAPLIVGNLGGGSYLKKQTKVLKSKHQQREEGEKRIQIERHGRRWGKNRTESKQDSDLWHPMGKTEPSPERYHHMPQEKENKRPLTKLWSKSHSKRRRGTSKNREEKKTEFPGGGREAELIAQHKKKENYLKPKGAKATSRTSTREEKGASRKNQIH